MVGETFGHYRIVELIGSGGMGVVYRAHDVALARDVALKMLHANVLDDAAARQRFVSEAQMLSQLNHPNICTVYEIGDVDGRTFIAMEFVKGRTLASVIPRDGLPLETTLRYGAEIADALAHAHRHGVVHRDLKSANVVITPEGRAKVLDFGLAKRVNGGPETETVAQVTTQPGVVVGTPAYMAPEVLAGAAVDSRSDVWALGVVLHEMAAGDRPFAGNTTAALASAIMRDPPRELPPATSAAFRGIVHRCLAKEPGQRYQSASEVRSALETVGASGPSVVVPTRPAGPKRLAWVLAGVGAVGLMIAFALTEGIWQRASQGPSIRSLAVLPLENLSGDPEQEYFADGMTEQLTADVSRISRLRVISRTSVMQYKNARKSLPEIARELNVDAVLEGSVVRAGDRVRVTARLIRAATDENIWAQSYERDLRDVLTLQGDVATSIAREIDVALTPQEESRLARGRRVEPEAHQAFLLGRFHAGTGIEEGLRKAIPYFKAAIEKDPGYAEAHAGLAEAYLFLASNYDRPRDVIPLAKMAASNALELDESLADAHAHMGFIHLFYDWDGPAAEREFARAIQLNPSLSSAHIYRAGHMLATGKSADAIPEVRLALQLDPLSLRAHALGTIFLIFARQYDEAIALAHKALELQPRFGLALGFQGLAYAEQGRFAEAVANLEKAAQLDKGAMVALFRAHVHAVAGNRSEAEKITKEVEKEAEHRYICPYEIATAYVSLRDHDKAYEWLRRGIAERADCMAWLGVEPWMEPFRSDPRYEEVLRDVGLHPVSP